VEETNIILVNTRRDAKIKAIAFTQFNCKVRNFPANDSTN